MQSIFVCQLGWDYFYNPENYFMQMRKNDLGLTMDFKVSDEPWTGKVLAVDGDTIMINAGKEVGLKDEAVFKGVQSNNLDLCVVDQKARHIRK